jgi:hypothetical protein
MQLCNKTYIYVFTDYGIVSIFVISPFFLPSKLDHVDADNKSEN